MRDTRFGTETEVTVYDRPSLSLVRTTCDGVGQRYLLRVRPGASRSLVNAALRALAEWGVEAAVRVQVDPRVTEYEFEDRAGLLAFAA